MDKGAAVLSLALGDGEPDAVFDGALDDGADGVERQHHAAALRATGSGSGSSGPSREGVARATRRVARRSRGRAAGDHFDHPDAVSLPTLPER